MTLPTNYRDGFEQAMANMFSNPNYSNSYLFYAHIIAQCKVIFDTEIQAPAGINFMHDHYNLYINPELFNELPIEHRLGVLKHEMLHVIYLHVFRKDDRDHQAFNYATDCAINQHIDLKHLPDDCITPANFPSKTSPVPPKLTAEQYYELIDKDKLPPDGGGTLDDHGKWDESKGDKDLQQDIAKSMMDKATSQTQKSRGNLPSEYAELMELLSRKREVDWRQVLRRITGNKRVGVRKTIMRRDRRLPNAEWIKGRTKDRKFDLLVISDVSGSVSDSALLSLWGEVRHICDLTQSSIGLIQVDTKPSKPEQLTKSTKIVTRKACGGTFLSPAIEMARTHHISFNAVVVTTDGYLDDSDVEAFTRLKVPIIWLVESEGRIMPSMTSDGMKAFQLKG